MSNSTPRLDLPLLSPSQAQKHVTHNEAIAALDALAQLVVTAFDEDTPPATPQENSIYGVGPAPTDDWAGQAGMLALRQNAGWSFLTPSEGWRGWDKSDGSLKAYSGGTWVTVVGTADNLDGVGIQATWDATNRLAVSSDAALFTHDGAGHQIKVNKAASTDTASLMFQTNFTGHAEMGLAGDDAFAIKVSADGLAWDTALRADPVTQTITADYTLAGTAVQQSADDATAGRLMRADWGYGQATVLGPVSQLAGQPTGALIESGSTIDGEYSRWADGTQICWLRTDLAYDNTTRLRFDWTFPVAFAALEYPVITVNLENEFGATPGPSELHGPFARQGNSPSTVDCSLRIYRSNGAPNFASSDTLPVHAVAIGRWF